MYRCQFLQFENLIFLCFPFLSFIIGLEGIAQGDAYFCIVEKFRKADSKFSA